MTKQHYKLIGKLYSATILYNTECAFDSCDILYDTTEEQAQIVAQAARDLGEKMAGKHISVLGMGSITEIAEYVESLYYE